MSASSWLCAYGVRWHRHLVNNAAIFGWMKLDFLITVDWDYFKKFMSVNLDGALSEHEVRGAVPSA
jgi:hypothetical protein